MGRASRMEGSNRRSELGFKNDHKRHSPFHFEDGMIPRIQPIPSYQERDRIFQFVKEILDERFDPRSGEPPARRLIVVKPNWIQEAHEARPDVWEPVMTHPVLVMAVIEALAEKMNGEGAICLCDAPSGYADFDAIVLRGGLKAWLQKVRRQWPSLKLELLDLRREIWVQKEDVVVGRRPNAQDPRGYVQVDLGKESLFYRHPGEGRYYGADYDRHVVNDHHHGEQQEYLLAGASVRCDLFINLPKLKTHKKTGLTCCLKNLVGINGDKNWLPHYTEGTPKALGDEFPDESVSHVLERTLKKAGQKLAMASPGAGTWIYRKIRKAGKGALGDSENVIRSGNWYGNDTCWRMVLDLNRAFLYANPDGSMRKRGEAKNYLAIVDGIVGGEGNGPLCPDPVHSGVLMAGDDPAALDAVACKLMGFDPLRVPMVREAFADHRWRISPLSMKGLQVEDRRGGRILGLESVEPAVSRGFKPHFGWDTIRDEKPGAG